MSAPRIQRLPRDLINKIAAGEVCERPASVVKELVENSVDAEASRIEVTLEDGGRKLIRVVDDGVGMPPEDMALAFESHATSKIASVEDLFQIHTMGFRGEALASIASVSRCRAVSRVRGAPEAASVECAAGRIGEVRACGAPEGTLVEARDLFFNTPARFKFLRSPATELRHAVETVTRLALPYPALALQLVHNEKPVLRLPSCESQRERIAAAFGDELAGRLLSIHSESSAMAVTGFVSPPGTDEASSVQYVFLNGRYIRDRAIQRAIAEAYRSRLMRGRFPAVFLNLQMDPGRVDVNVHPTKIEVRFRDSGAVFAQVFAALENTLRASGPAAGEAAAPPPPAADRRENIRRAVTEFFDRVARRGEPFDHVEAGAPATPSASPAKTEAGKPAGIQFPTPSGDLDQPGARPQPSPERAAPAAPSLARSFCQVHDTYIVEETPGGFLVIDQHALHERILYEELRQRVSHATVPRQRLLVPEIVDLPPQEFLRAMELREALLKMGVEVEQFGERTVAIHGIPHLAVGANPRELLLQVLQDLGEAASDKPGEREEQILRSIACKAAVKAGERLSRAQVQALLDRRDRLGPEPTCPHGRPTTLRYDLRELERQFRRK